LIFQETENVNFAIVAGGTPATAAGRGWCPHQPQYGKMKYGGKIL